MSTPSSLSNYFAKTNASIYGNLKPSTNAGTVYQSPQDAGFVGFTGVRANANSLQIIAPNGQSGFISLNQAQNLGIQTPSGVVPLVNSQGIDFTGVQRFATPTFGTNQVGIVPSTAIVGTAGTTPTPSQTNLPSNTTNPGTGRSISDTVNLGLGNLKKFFSGPQGGIALAVVAGLGLFLVLRK